MTHPEDEIEFEDQAEEPDDELAQAEFEPPKIYGAEHLLDVENPRHREELLQEGHKLEQKGIERWEKNEAKMASGIINRGTAELDQLLFQLPEERKWAMRVGLATEKLTYDHLGDISEDQDMLATGKAELLDLKVDVQQAIRDLGPDTAQTLADEMLEDGRIKEAGHESISRQIRLQRFKEE